MGKVVLLFLLICLLLSILTPALRELGKDLDKLANFLDKLANLIEKILRIFMWQSTKGWDFSPAFFIFVISSLFVADMTILLIKKQLYYLYK